MTIPRPVTAVRALKVRPDRHLELPEDVATEEPMQILVAGPGQEPSPLAVTMRTPGHDFELAAGFVLTEGVAGPHQIASVDYCRAADRSRSDPDPDPDARYNTVTVRLTEPFERDSPARYFAASSSCGACGKSTIDQVRTHCPVVAPGPPFPAELVPGLPERLREAQKAFDRTGGLHAAGLFGRDGSLRCAREDVGRHNAVDKVVGWMVLARQAHSGPSAAPPGASDLVLAVSGRVSFEIVQKAAMAGIGLLAAVSAPSSLAVQAAERLGVAVAAFVRGDSFNLYSHAERVTFES